MQKVYHAQVCYNIFMKKYVHIGVCIILCVPFTSIHAFSFTRTLSEGSVGPDVIELQKILNSNPATQVASDGAGSPGNETDYFGSRTRQAVVIFQNLNAQTILTPLGLLTGTGFVGNSTITFLNTIDRTTANGQANQFDTQGTTVSMQTNPLLTQTPSTFTPTNTSTALSSTAQFFLNPTVVKAGEDTYVASDIALKNATFMFGTQLLSPTCYSDYTCTLTIPQDNPVGISTLSISNPSLGSRSLTVLSSDAQAPDTSVTTLSLSKDNLITGTNFSPTMTIQTSFGTFTTQTQNNQFILSFPPTTTTQATSTGILILENDTGLTSDILFVQYEA